MYMRFPSHRRNFVTDLVLAIYWASTALKWSKGRHALNKYTHSSLSVRFRSVILHSCNWGPKDKIMKDSWDHDPCYFYFILYYVTRTSRMVTMFCCISSQQCLHYEGWIHKYAWCIHTHTHTHTHTNTAPPFHLGFLQSVYPAHFRHLNTSASACQFSFYR